jgi:hypothetical protein
MQAPWRILWRVGAAALLLSACASPITHPVALTYTGQARSSAESLVAVGIQPFEDRREPDDPFLIGYRSLGRGERERYVSSPDDIAQSVTRMTAELIQRKGGQPAPLAGWDYTPDRMLALTDACDIFVGGQIRTLRCKAEKRLMHTRMVLELDIVIYIGMVREGVVHRRPVNMRTERVAAAFGPEELRRFMNEMLSEALERGCRDIP